jgi:hypothetical protein
VLLPERLEALVDRLDLLSHCGVAPLGQRVPEGNPALAERVDLVVEFRVDEHASVNEERAYPIPRTDNRSAAGDEEHDDGHRTDDERGPGEQLQRGRHS